MNFLEDKIGAGFATLVALHLVGKKQETKQSIAVMFALEKPMGLFLQTGAN